MSVRTDQDHFAPKPVALEECYHDPAGDWRPSVCIVSNEIIGPHKNGGIGTAMTGLAEHLANIGCRVTILYTGAVFAPHVALGGWKRLYAEIGIEFVSLSMEGMKTIDKLTNSI